MKLAVALLALSCLGCSGPAAVAPTSEEPAPIAGGAEAAPPAAVETWWMDDVPEERAEGGLEANARADGLRDGVTVTLNETALFPDRFRMTTLFAPDHAMHASIPDADAQWRFSLRPGPSEVVLRVPAEAATNWMMGPPMFYLHETGRRWPSVVLVAPGRAASEVRATFSLGDVSPEDRRPVVAAPEGVVPVLFLRTPDARVDVEVNGQTAFSAENLSIHVAPLIDPHALVSGRNTVTLTITPAAEDAPADDEEASEPAPPSTEYLLVVGAEVYPGRVVHGAEPVQATIEVELP